MRRIISKVSTASSEFAANAAHHRGIAADLAERQRSAREDRPERDRERLARQGKMGLRERLAALLDPGTPFLELSTLAAGRAYGGAVPGAGQLTGIGIVGGRAVVVRADDPAVKGGAWYPHPVQNILSAPATAVDNRP